ncbi:MAG: putative Glycosyltransferase, group 1 [Ilumatobacteraceae bacterium]|nr:putative Glycosyltransferase, group 1 [Ilumatobacteraceae bacterium]
MIGAPVRVVHLITRLDVGGAQETAVRICAGLDRDRFAPELWCGPDQGSGGSLRDSARDADVPVIEISHLHGPIRPLADARAVREVRTRLQRERPAILQTHSSKAGVIGRKAAARGSGPKVVHTVHGWSFNDSQAAPVALGYRLIERVLARRSAALVVVTTADRTTGLAHRIGRPEQYVLIRSGIDLAETASAAVREATRTELGWAPDDLVVASVGRLEAQKDPLTLVEALASARAEVPQLRAVLVGGGSLEAQVRTRADALGVADRLDLLGLRDDVPAVLAAADLFALSSRWEGLPRAALEAARAGLPIAATDTGGIRELVVDGVSGRLVPIGDAAALATALVALAEDRAGASALAAAASARLPEFTTERMVADTEALYDRLLGPPPPSRKAPDR